jgi:hypothetical protein
MATIPEEVNEILNRLPADKQRQVLDYARSLDVANTSSSPLPPGTPFEVLRAFKPTLSPETVDEMQRAIEEECERIEPDTEDLSF